MGLQLVYKSAEVRLTGMLADLRVQPTGWIALHFHLDRLLDEYKSEYQIKIAINLINDLLKNYDGHLFLLVDSSIMVLCNRIEQVIQEKLIFQLRYLYMDDPLSYTESGMENPQFVTSYDIKHNWQAFNEVCQRYMGMVARGQPLALQPLNMPAEPAPAELPMPERMPVLEKTTMPELPSPAAMQLSASRLAALENTLRVTDLQSTIRRQPVCAVYTDMGVRRLYEELYINIAHLRRMMQSDVDFLSNRWLFRYITQILDARMIDLLRINPGRYLESPISINLNVETVLSSRFSELDAMIPAAKKVAIVIELPVVDAFADMTAFNLAVAEAQKLGYRVCLDGLTTASFISIQRGQFTVDLLKVQWNGEGASDGTGESPMARAVQDAGGNRIILCRCDNKKAIEYGHAMGISLFQGRFIDTVLNPTSKVEN
ncbi:MAG: hypothetical protein EBV03_05785 [Proteobacteria bacterium]|nr:hypothetical protein [Pseudomonadota bacterium]